MEAGRTPDVMVVDEPVTINGWSPRNFEPEFMGQITLETALAPSVNPVAARLADEVGRDNVAAVAHRMGIVSQVNTDLPKVPLVKTEVVRWKSPDGLEVEGLLTYPVSYEKGKRYDDMPPSHRMLINAKPIFEEMPGWSESPAGARTLAELPSSVRRYVERISELVGVPIAMIGVGKEREATIVVRNPFAD